ncbi:MAG: YihY/virulence factor BrkB family protein [Chitinophagaceae bacterium]|nr:YihY/virulence factor BrkB family protein [Chitinophagaceae bacterium]MCW5927266.1 YihY/virulence factor BrkB family protein [Chitinophagaceae bacterium]
MTPKNLWKIVTQSGSEFMENRVFKLSAALAYYTVFSFPGLIIMVIWVSDLFYGQAAIEGTIYGQISGLVGKDAALQIQDTIRNATLYYQSGFARIVGSVTLIFAATGIFSEIQDSINLIWHLKAKPKKGWVKLIVNRLLSFSVIVSLGFILLVSLIVNAFMDILIHKLTSVFPESQVVLAYMVNLVLSFLVTAVLFGMIFKVLPDARISWKHVRAGAFATALLFMIGKLVIGYYLGQNRLSTAYGAAGYVIIVLLWVYYSAVILYFGAIFTRVYVVHAGSHIYPNKYAVWIREVEVESQSSLQQQPATGGDTDKNI